MQLYAKDPDVGIIFVDHAKKQKDYRCLECASIIRVRGGTHRQNHFYHVEAHRSCSLHAKSMTHIQIQCHLQQLLSPQECMLERWFPEICRIADVVWTPHRLIFEIQCSQISADEIGKRNGDYASIGYQVIWILHDNRFNQWRLSAAEHFLRNFPHYYTNIDPQGQGMIYDQYSLYHRGMRKAQLTPLPVNVKIPFLHVPHKKIKFFRQTKASKSLFNRMHYWPIYFSGDLLFRCLSDSTNFFQSSYWSEILDAEEVLERKNREPRSFFLWIKECLLFILHPYRLFFNSILEKMCK